MHSTQRMIKGFAVALAVIIIGSILGALVSVGMIFGVIFGDNSQSGISDANSDNSGVLVGGRDDANDLVEEELQELFVDVNWLDVYIVDGDEFAVEGDRGDVEVRRAGGTLRIEERDRNFAEVWDWGWNDEKRGKIVIRVPSGKKFRTAKMDTGAGRVEIDRLEADDLSLEFGVGRVVIKELVARRFAKIETGAGVVEIRKAELTDLGLDMGVGKVDMKVAVREKGQIQGGMGELNLQLIGDNDDYCVELDQGIGAVEWHDLEQNNLNGKVKVKIDAGVGKVNLGLSSL